MGRVFSGLADLSVLDHMIICDHNLSNPAFKCIHAYSGVRPLRVQSFSWKLFNTGKYLDPMYIFAFYSLFMAFCFHLKPSDKNLVIGANNFVTLSHLFSLVCFDSVTGNQWLPETINRFHKGWRKTFA